MTTSKLYTFYEKTIINNIDFDGYEISNDCYLYDKIKTLYNIFKSEYVHGGNIHLPENVVFAEWLRGLPSVLTVPFYNYEILENALAEDDKVIRMQIKNDEDDFLDKYWIRLANAFFTLKENL